MFKIKWFYYSTHWLNAGNLPTVIVGLTRYATKELAEKQAAIFKNHFPDNKYFVEVA